MDRRIRQVAGLLTVLLIAIALSAGYVQGLNAERIATYEPVSETNPDERARNRFRIFQECRWPRGDILSVDGQTLAETVEAPPGGTCLYQRRYPMGPLAPHVVGTWSLHFGKTGLEAAYNQDLVGDEAPPESITEFFSERPRIGNNLVATVDTRLQQAALDALDGRRGGVVAMHPRTGAVFVAASNPSYDATPLASNDRTIATRARCELGAGVQIDEQGNIVRNEAGEPIPCENVQRPLLSTALQTRRPPGSTFKVVTAAAALESGEYTPTSPSVGSTRAYTPPGATRAIHNYGGGSCGGNLTNAIRVSCNTAMARIAVDIGAEQFLTTAHAMGLDQFSGRNLTGCDAGPRSEIRETWTGCLPSAVRRASGGEEPLEASAFRALAGFGQGPVLTSPFGMAIVTATIANDGFIPRPRFADRVIDRTGATVREIRTGVGAAALSDDTAEAVKAMMRAVVTSGTASRAFRGFPHPVGGKTGTADEPTCDADSTAIFGAACPRMAHTWFIAFAPVTDPSIAIAVFVERGGGIRGGTGGEIAAPIARTIIQRYFELYPAAAGVDG